MPYITIRSVAPLTIGNRDAYSRWGHAWLEISGSQNSSNGIPESYGFYPRQDGQPYMPGTVKDTDYANFVGFGSNSPAYYITEAQAQALRNFAAQVEATGFYSVIPGHFGSGQNCATFAFAAMLEVGITAAFPMRSFLPWWMPGQFDPATGNLMELEIGINPTVATTFAVATTVAPALTRRDPLILDLGGDGLDTIGIDTANPILFDHDGDGIKTATGWIKPSDAFLVLDRNGNGAIDTGAELFGDATPLYAGGLAADGFAALAQEDSNADGRVDALDTRFDQLRLWTDLNQDGISQGDELFTLEQKGIAALLVAKTENTVVLANGNQIADLGGYLRSDGSGGTLGAAEQLADVDLASNPFYSQFTDSIPLTAAALALPEMNGAGQVRSLQQAASLATPAGAALATQLVAYAAETTRSGQMARLDGLVKAWADTSAMATTATGAFAGVNLNVSFAGVGAGTAAYQAWLDKLTILERFNGQTFLPVPAAGTTLTMDFYNTREALLNQAYQSLKDSVYGALVLQTRLKPYLDSIELRIDEGGIALDYAAMTARLDTLKSADPTNAVLDLMELQRFAGTQLTGWQGTTALEAWLADPVSGAAVTTALVAAGLARSGYWSGTQSGDDAIGSVGADQFSGNGGDDVLIGRLGDDALAGGVGNDKSRRWWYGERNAIGTAANGAMFEMRRAG